ncbi:MAG: winged helix-turn-helix transcriptional regulator, partial [Janthinobacterium lividum]|nr:winged helix-turn-helix transcriptional regulator [Janthinobacterium lividum]
MPASCLFQIIAALPLQRGATEPLFRQLYAAIKAAILDGRMSAGMQLPPTRDFCRLLAVSRQTVLNAYALLAAEGYLDGAVGRGTFVSRDVPQPVAAPAGKAEAAGLLRPLSARGRGVVAAMRQ